MKLWRPKLIALSAAVAAQASLVDLYLRKSTAERFTPLVQAPLTLAMTDVHRAVTPMPGRAVFTLSYTFHGTDDDNQQIFEALLTYILELAFHDGARPMMPALRAFAAVGAVEVAHPYLREHLHSLSLRMGLPPLALDLAPPSAP